MHMSTLNRLAVLVKPNVSEEKRYCRWAKEGAGDNVVREGTWGNATHIWGSVELLEIRSHSKLVQLRMSVVG